MDQGTRILIIGGSSFVGRHLFAKLGPSRVLATYCRRPIEHGVYFDALSMRLSDVIKTPHVFSHAVLLLGDTHPDSCAADIPRSYALNVKSLQAILASLKELRLKPVFASSEFVFDGTRGNYVEGDPVHPILTYGKQKVEVERFLQETCDNYLIVRFAKILGTERSDGTLLTNWLDVFERERTIRCAADQFFSPIHVEDVVEAILRLIERDCQGLFHVAGEKPFSRLGLLELLVARLRAQTQIHVKVVPCSIHDFPLRERRPLNVSMRPDKFIKSTGIRISSMEELCDRLVGRVAASV